VLLLVSVGIAVGLPPAFQAMLIVYAAVTTAYSLVLKQRPILDVITLAGLYTIRVVAGAALVTVSLSRWFLAFSVFFFFSLALVKRVVEMSRRVGTDSEGVPGRGYQVGDIPVLRSLGTTSVMASAIVYCLYITGSEVTDLYTQPDLLWIGLPILLYWQSRVWLLVGRDRLHEDPVTFALTDRASRILLLGFLVVVWVAA
jgi:4-hydroxybenzoate polyprenyltransferase